MQLLTVRNMLYFMALAKCHLFGVSFSFGIAGISFEKNKNLKFCLIL